MSNFKFLLSDPAFAPFEEVAMAAEKKDVVGNPAEPRQTGIAEKIPDAEILWIKRIEVKRDK